MFGIFKKKPTPQVEIQTHAALIVKIEHLPTEGSNRVHSPDRSMYRVRSLHRNIQELNSFIQKVIMLLSNSSFISPLLFRNEIADYGISSWFVGTNGRYVDDKHELELFKTRSIDLLKILQKLELSTNEQERQKCFFLVPLVNEINHFTNVITEIMSHVKPPVTNMKSVFRDPTR